jgi:hypothetical protein
MPPCPRCWPSWRSARDAPCRWDDSARTRSPCSVPSAPQPDRSRPGWMSAAHRLPGSCEGGDDRDDEIAVFQNWARPGRQTAATRARVKGASERRIEYSSQRSAR